MSEEEKHQKKSAPVPYEPTAHERTVLNERAARRANKAPGMKRQPRKRQVMPNHPNLWVGYELMFDEMGVDSDQGIGLVEQLAKVAVHADKVDLHRLNFMLSVVKGVQPKDPIEALLVSQMAVTHMAAMDMAQRMMVVDDAKWRERCERSTSRLMRIFATQMDTLKRFRSSGEQKILVQKMTVSDGGQAIVGNVTHNGNSGMGAPAAPMPAVPYAQTPAMPIIDSEGVQTAPQKVDEDDE